MQAVLENQRAQYVADRVMELCSGRLTGKDDFCPTSPQNFSEFLQNMGDEAETELRELSCEIITGRSGRANSKCSLGLYFFCHLQDYWTKAATARAEEDVPSLAEIHEDNITEAQEARA